MLEGDEKIEKTAAAMVESALDHVKILEDMDFTDIKISLKASDVPTTILAYQLIADRVEYPLHLGITEAGTPKAGMVKSAVGLGVLLYQGIGDTLRVSLAAESTEEVFAGIRDSQVAWTARTRPDSHRLPHLRPLRNRTHRVGGTR